MKRLPTSARILTFALLLGTVRAPAAIVPQPPERPAEEITQICTLLDQARELSKTPERLEGALVAMTAVGAELDVFELRYGTQPTACDEWNQVRERATTLLPVFERLSGGGMYFNQDSARVARCVLLELSGNPEKALAMLDQIQPGGGCGNWKATVMMAVEERESGIYQRMGNYRKALDCQNAALRQVGLSLYSPEPDLMYARHAFLLEKTGDTESSVREYQRVVDLYPGVAGSALARKALTAHKRLIEPTASRICGLYLKAGKKSEPEEAIFALANHRFPESYAILTERLKTAVGWERNRIIPALGQLGDPRAAPVLREIVQSNADDANCIHALTALHRLGDDSMVVSYLRRYRESDHLFETEWFDRALREIYGDGPKITVEFNTKAQEFADAWLRWLELNPGKPGR